MATKEKVHHSSFEVIEIAALDKLKAERDELLDQIRCLEFNLKQKSDEIGRAEHRGNTVNYIYDKCETYGRQVLELGNALRDMVGALERLTKVGPPSIPTTGADWAAQCLKDNCEIAKASLAKHEDLIKKVKGDK